MKIAYLNTQYPKLSHTFIEREIRAIREHVAAHAIDLTIDTFSVRVPSREDILGEHHAKEAANTFCLLASKPRLLLAQLAHAIRHPIRTIRTHARAQSISADGLAARLRSVTYACEAILLARELAQRSIRHLHVHMANNGAAVALLACVAEPSIDYSMTIHGSAEFFDVHRLNLKAKCESARFVRAISNFCRAQIMAWTSPSVWNRFHVIHCAVDPQILTPAPPRQPGPIRLLTVGRLEPIKGYSMLLDALAMLKAQGLDWRLEIVGSGQMDPSLKDQATRLGLADRITFTGPLGQDDIPAAYDRNDALIVSSFMEGVPVVLMEAMAKELIPISTAVGGVPELITPGVSGLVCPPGSPEALARIIRTVAESPDTLQSMRRAARQTIIDEYNIAYLGLLMTNLFLENLAPHHAEAPT